MKVSQVIKMLARDYEMDDDLFIVWYSRKDFTAYGVNGSERPVTPQVWGLAHKSEELESFLEQTSLAMWEHIHDVVGQIEEGAKA